MQISREGFSWSHHFSFVLWLLASCWSPLLAQKNPYQNVENALSQFHLTEVEQLVSDIQDRGYQKFYACNLLMYKFLSTQDPAYAQQVRGNWKPTIATLESLPEADPLKYVLISELFCKRSALEFLDQNYLTAVRLARTGRVYIRRNQNKHPENVEQLKILGMMNILLGAVPAKYQWITNSLGFKGNLTEGISQLEAAASQSGLLKLEAQLLLSFVEKNILDQPGSAIERMTLLRSQSGPNFVIDYFLATGLIGMKRNEEALTLLSQRDQYVNDQVFFVPFWDYQLGRAYYFKNDHRNAQRYLARFIKAYKGRLVRTDANFRLGLALTLNGSYTLGKQFFKTIMEEKVSDLDEDAYAQHMASKFYVQEPSATLLALFRARNYFDGGYYEQALAELMEIQKQYDRLLPDEVAEFHYRYARVLHAQGDLPLALEQYQKCVSVPLLGEGKYLQAYAWFYQAGIARGAGELELARTHYKKALSFDGYFYQTGLENRCKAALTELKRHGG